MLHRLARNSWAQAVLTLQPVFIILPPPQHTHTHTHARIRATGKLELGTKSPVPRFSIFNTSCLFCGVQAPA